MLRHVAAVALACAAVALSACGTDHAAEVHTGFMNGCTRDAPESFCQCLYEKMTARYTPEDAARRYQSGQLTRAELQELARPCQTAAAG